MRSLRADLHVHSVLSPCGELSMSPRAIVALALQRGLNVLALTDHNSAANTPALRAAAAGTPLAVLFGVEARSVEEVDVVCVFDTVEAALAFGDWCYTALPDVPGDPELFGDQVIVDADDEILGFEPRLLIGGLYHSLAEICDEARARGGLVIAAHVDRACDSVISQLGWLPDDVRVDAAEVTRFGDEALLALDHPWLAGLPIVRSSDAHRPDDLGYQQTEFHVPAPTVAELKLALAGQAGRWARPVRRALAVSSPG